jgi:hypothetical protein
MFSLNTVYPNDLFQLKIEVWRHDSLGYENLKELEDENRRLKRIYADFSLQNEGLKNVIAKKF